MRTRDRKNVVDVKELLSSFTQEEHISEWKCEKCSSSGCVRQAGIARPPNVLLVHISRIQQGWAPQVTVDRDLTIQYDGSSANTRRKVRYLLFAMIVYRSMGANGGHYFAFVRAGRGQREQWYLADDDEIRSVSFADVQREEPFMLLYEAQKMIPPVETDADAWLVFCFASAGHADAVAWQGKLSCDVFALLLQRLCTDRFFASIFPPKEKKLLEAELVQASVKAQAQRT